MGCHSNTIWPNYAEEVDELIKHWNYVADRAKALEKEEIGTLYIGVIEPVMLSALPAILSQFRALKPRVTCHFSMGNTELLAQELVANRIDFAVSGEPVAAANLRFEPLYEEQISFIVARDHPLAMKSELTVEDLVTNPLFIGGANCLYHMRLERELDQLPAQQFMYTVGQISAIPAYVQSSPSIGVVLSSTQLSQDIVSIPFSMTNPNITIGLLQNSKQDYISTTQRLFMQLLIERSLYN